MSSNMHRAQLPGSGEMRRPPGAASPGAGHRAGVPRQRAAAEWHHLSLANGVMTWGQWSFNCVKALRI